MRELKTKLISNFKKLSKSLKRAYRKLKYLDKTQLNYYIITGFIGSFCLFTGATYSIFTVSKYLNAATITIAKLNYTLASSSSGYSNGVVTVPAGETKYIDLTLSSLNPIKTKYALNYSAESSDVLVQYSQNLKYNMTGNIGTSGSSISMRIVIINNGSSSQAVSLSAAGGYEQNTINSNITSGFYEQDVTVRTILYDENLSNPVGAADFPSKTSDYAYYKTECSENANPEWNYSSWSVNLNQVTKQISCDVYFKKITVDIELLYNVTDSNGNNTVSTTPPANDGTYFYWGTSCSSPSNTSWDNDTWKLKIEKVSNKNLCVANFGSYYKEPVDTKDYLNTHIASLTEADGVYNENGYRYEGLNPNNYITFNNETWRIIGVFNTLLTDGTTTKPLVKIIKEDSIGNYPFDNTTDISSYGSNAWERLDGTKATVNTLLNTYYYNSRDGSSLSLGNWTSTGLNETSRELIEDVTWNLGGTGSYLTASGMYTAERGTTVPSNNKSTSIGKIGLMYPSDYGYSVPADLCGRITTLVDYDTGGCYSNSWIYKSDVIQWTLSPYSSNASNVWYVGSSGRVGYSSAYRGCVIRPVLYLNSSAYIVSGDGTSGNPYVIES